jgi:hypothetical protein
VFFNAEIRPAKNRENALIHRVMTVKYRSKNIPFLKTPFKNARKSMKSCSGKPHKFFCKNAKI